MAEVGINLAIRAAGWFGRPPAVFPAVSRSRTIILISLHHALSKKIYRII